MTRHPTGTDRGSALLIVLVLIVLATTATVTIATRGEDVTRTTALAGARERAFAAAEAGLETARHRLRLDPLWTGGRETIDGCEVTIGIERSSPGTWLAHSTAALPGSAVIGPGVCARVDATLAATVSLPRVVAWSVPGRTPSPAAHRPADEGAGVTATPGR
ncbi:MAG: hypothetical protein IPM29_10480 [Planctomycetes bacterium]|nr:hypothetical protein [Planctomycetota bacterium]